MCRDDPASQSVMLKSVRSAFVSSFAPNVTTFFSYFPVPATARSLRYRWTPGRINFARQVRTTTMKETTSSKEEVSQKPGIIPTDLRQEMTRSYMEYAMSVILGRAMPDVRDGFKPVHRRILFAMHQLGLAPSGPFRKSARVVGEVLGKYHPHGDVAVYDALVRMAQTFSMSLPLVNGHGNFGSTDGDPPAAMRYTECKLAAVARDAVLKELDRDTVEFYPNFDGSESEPLVLPVLFPNLLVNGSSGIAVGMATNIPPHNLGEILRALIALVRDPSLSDDALFDIVPAPDFPTGGQILGTADARSVYLSGRGRVLVRACVHPEVVPAEGIRRHTRDAIVVTQLPYQVNKATLVAKIADLVNEKKLEGISDLRDESDRNGTRIVIELKRDAKMPVVLNHLFKKTPLQSSFAANMMALDSGRFPKRLTLREFLSKFLTFRRDTIRRRLTYDLKQTNDRLHLVHGFVLVQRDVDAVIALIRAAKDAVIARAGLIDQYGLSEVQAAAVLDMQLRRLTAMESQRLKDEEKSLSSRATELRATLDSPERLDALIVQELREIGNKYATERRSTIIRDDVLQTADIDELSLLSNDQSVITVTQQGYIKRMETAMFVNQNRGTRGKRGIGRLRAGDEIGHLFTCMTHDSLLAVSTDGIAYHLEAHKVPISGLGSRGVPIFQLLPAVEAGETMASVMPVGDAGRDEYVVLLTRRGFVKRVSVSEVVKVNSRGKRVISLESGDELKWAKRCREGDSIVIASQSGNVLRFYTDAAQLRSSGRTSRGVRSMRLDDGDELADMDIIPSGADGNDMFLLTVSKDGKGKRVACNAFRLQGRGGRGVIGIRLADEEQDDTKDCVVALQTCRQGDSVMLIASDGTIVRTKVDKIPVQGRTSRGVRMQRLADDVTVAAVAVLQGDVLGDEDEEDEQENGGSVGEESLTATDVDDDYDDDLDSEEPEEDEKDNR